MNVKWDRGKGEMRKGEEGWEMGDGSGEWGGRYKIQGRRYGVGDTSTTYFTFYLYLQWSVGMVGMVGSPCGIKCSAG